MECQEIYKKRTWRDVGNYGVYCGRVPIFVPAVDRRQVRSVPDS